MQRIKAVIPTFLCTPPCVWAPPAFEVTQRCCQNRGFTSSRELKFFPSLSFPSRISLDAFSQPNMGGVVKEANFFPPCLSLGKRKLCLGSHIRPASQLWLWAHLATRMDAEEGSSPRSQGETSRPFEVLPCASATCQRDALIRWQQLINSLDFFFFRGAPTPGPKRRRKFVIQSETAVKKKKK